MGINKEKIEEMTEYFSGELAELEKQMIDADYIYNILKDEAVDLKNSKQRGTFKYTVDTFNNLITISGQKQSILKDQFSIKKAIVDIVMKDKSDDNSGTEIKDILLDIMKNNRTKKDKRDEKIDSVKKNIDKIKSEQ
jgi:hypothetical protein